MPFQTTLDLSKLLGDCRVNRGPLAGSYLTAPGDIVNWYFVNLGLTGFLPKADAALLADVGAHLQHFVNAICRDTFVIKNLAVNEDGTIGAACSVDADDSTAATFVSLACSYAAKHQAGTIWLNGNLALVKGYARANLITPRIGNTGLTTAKQLAADYPFALLEDNCEVYRGLRDFADFLLANGLADAAEFDGYAKSSQAGVTSMFGAKAKRWNPVMDLTGNFPPDNPQTYDPDGTGQLFPTAYQVGASASQQASGYTFLNNSYRGWPQSNLTVDQPDGYPWLILGYAAALLGHPQDTNAQLRRAEGLNARWLSINELGWCQRILDLP